MDIQSLADSFSNMTCIVSVEKRNGTYGDIRIEAGNSKFRGLVSSGTDGVPSDEFIPGSLYDRYIPKDLSFEEVCFRAAVNKEPVHTYIHPNKLDIWLSVFVMPVEYEAGDKCYCSYSMKKCDVSEISIGTTRSVESLEDVVRTCIKLYGADDFNKTLNDVISDIRILCGAAICTIISLDTSAGTYSVLSKSSREQNSRRTVTKDNNFYDIALSWIDTIGDSDCLIIKDDKDMQYIRKVNDMWYQSLAASGVKSIVLFPLRYNNEILGFIWATNFDTRNTKRIKETLELTTFFISSHLANYNMMKKLEHISYTDMLTGVMNRNAMNNRITAIVSGEEKVGNRFGVIFADLNGLKQVNDTYGHTAGDLMLRKAAIILQELFDGYEIYRAGGDEFMIIGSDCREDEFERKVMALREINRESGDVCFAVGSYFPASACDIRDAMHIADENMYKDKESYYSTYPERKR